MLKSQELKIVMDKLADEIKAMQAAGESVPAEKESALQNAIVDYRVQKIIEDNEKGEHIHMDKKPMSRAEVNKALKSFFLGKALEIKDAATGQNGVTPTAGGALIREEMLNLAELDAQGVDLRTYATVMSVHARSGKVPIIDYKQSVTLSDFDENSEIAETAGVFGELKYTMASKGGLIPVSNELLRDADADVLAILETLFGRVYVTNVGTSILAAVEAATDVNKTTVTAFDDVAALDAIKKAIIECPIDAGANAITIMNQKTFGLMALVKDKQGRYMLPRDTNNATIRMIEGRPVVVVENDMLADDKVIVGDLRAVYHIANPELEVAASDQAGFTRNSTLVRAICRFTDACTYGRAFTIITKAAA